MKAAELDTLPLATTSPFTPRSRPLDGGHAGWARALAQASDATAPAQGRPEGCTPAAQARAAWAAIGKPPEFPGADAVSRALPPERAAGRVALQTPFATNAMGALPTHVVEPQGDPWVATASRMKPTAGEEPRADACPSRPAPRGDYPRAPQAPVRVHVEQRAGGIAVWLGMDRSAVCDVGALLAQLRAARGAGPPLVSFTCNGTTVYARPAGHKENP